MKAIVATAQTEKEAIAIFAEVAKTHAFIEFHKIDGCQVTIVYEPEKDRLDRINREAQAEQAALPLVKKPAKKLTIEDLEAKVKQLGLDKDLFVTVTAWRPDKPQEYKIYDDTNGWKTSKSVIFKSKSAIAVSRKLAQISKERQSAKIGHTLALDPSQPINIQKVCPHCDRPMEKGETCCTATKGWPSFTSYIEAMEYIQDQIKNHGQKYYCTDEYKSLFPTIKRMAQEEKDKTHNQESDQAAQAMLEAGIVWGDKVEWHNVGIMTVEVITGIIINKKGIPFVRLDTPINGKKACKWHKGFIKTSVDADNKAAVDTEPPKIEGFQTIVSQTGLIQTVDNGSIVDYKIGKFSYLCDGNDVIVTKVSGTGIVNVAHYTYKSEEEAQEAGWKMARKQETVEKEILNQQKAAVKVTATAAKQRQGKGKQKVKASN